MAYREDQLEDGDDSDVDGRDADWEDPDPADVDDSDDPELVPCPCCGKEISEDTELCSHCKSYIVQDDAPGRYPRWLVVGIVMCILIVLLWVTL